MAKSISTAESELEVIRAIGRGKARTVAAIVERTGIDRRKVTRVLGGMKKGPPGDYYLDGEKQIKLGKRGVGRLRFLA